MRSIPFFSWPAGHRTADCLCSSWQAKPPASTQHYTWSLLVGCLSFCVSSAVADDLTKIDRSIGKEPVYQSKSPKYCLLVFGPRAETRVWLVLDLVSEPRQEDGSNNALYVDRNGNGDLTEADERISGTMRESHLIVTFS